MRNPRRSRSGSRLLRRLRPLLVAALASAPLLAGAVPALAQEHEGANPQEIQEKIREIEKLMKRAEESLARSTVKKSAGDEGREAARRMEKLLEQKAQEQTGKSADALRKEAAEGSSEAAEALKRLTEEARAEAQEAGAKMEGLLGEGESSATEAGEGVRKLLEETKRSGREARDGIQWLLDNATSQSGGGSGGPKKPDPGGGKKPPDDQQPKGGDKKPDKSQQSAKKPEHLREPPRTPEFEVWLAELPPQVRRAYESEDWDAIPSKWRSILRAWTKKMADELESGR